MKWLSKNSGQCVIMYMIFFNCNKIVNGIKVWKKLLRPQISWKSLLGGA